MVALCSLLARADAIGKQLLQYVFCLETGHMGKEGKSAKHDRGKVCGFWQPDSLLCTI